MKNYNKIFLLTILLPLLLSCSEAPMQKKSRDTITTKNLNNSNIFFGHQSVGNNILDGIKTLSVEDKLPIVIIDNSVKSITPGKINIFHKKIGKNEDPVSKIKDFSTSLNNLTKKVNVDIAMMKLCFYDFNKNTDVGEVFDKYKSTMNELKSEHKNITFIHITTPLVENSKTYKYYIKKLIGKEIYNEATNKIRMEYNNLLLNEYDKKYIFDLAYVESVPENNDKNQRLSEYLLRDEYTSDGGHLNERGQKVVSTELINFLDHLKSN